MATRQVVEQQTSEIIKYLLSDQNGASFRQLRINKLETDSPSASDDGFDAALIAAKLKSIADSLTENPTFKAALNDLKKAAAEEAAEAAFSDGVFAVCQTQGADVASEFHLIRASVTLGLYIIKTSPDLKNKVQGAMTAFFNRHMCTWVTQQGGWGKVDI